MGFIDEVKDAVGDGLSELGELPGGLRRAAKSLFEEGMPLAGVAASKAGLFVFGPGSLLAVATVAASRAAGKRIRHRSLSDAERELARRVFGEKPPAGDIVLTNLAGRDGRAFTVPNPLGEVLIGLGEAYENPASYESRAYPAAGQLLVHELVHAWQIANARFKLGYLCVGAWEQLRYTLGEDVYEPAKGGPNWDDFSNEQQATVIDRWYAAGCRETHPYFRYVLEVR